jgi:hypothetical protein
MPLLQRKSFVPNNPANITRSGDFDDRSKMLRSERLLAL